MPQRSTPNSGAATVKIHSIFPTACTATSQNTKSYWTPQSMAHLLTTRTPKVSPPPAGSFVSQGPSGFLLTRSVSAQMPLPRQALPPTPSYCLCFLFSTACTIISSVLGMFCLFLLLEHTSREGRDGVFLSSQCTAQAHDCIQRECECGHHRKSCRCVCLICKILF